MVSLATFATSLDALWFSSSEPPASVSMQSGQMERDRTNIQAMAKLLHVVKRDMLESGAVKSEDKE